MKRTSMLLAVTVLAPLFTLAVTPFFTTLLTHDGSMGSTIDGVAIAGPASGVMRVAVAPAAAEAAPAKTSWFELATYPTPSHPSTTVAYSLLQAETVRLSVYDVLGREVRRLVDGDQAAGRHEVVFDAGTLPSGTYFYRIETPSGVQTRKLVLLK